MAEESSLPSLSLSLQESLQSQMFVSPLKPYAETYSQGDGIEKRFIYEERISWILFMSFKKKQTEEAHLPYNV